MTLWQVNPNQDEFAFIGQHGSRWFSAEQPFDAPENVKVNAFKHIEFQEDADVRFAGVGIGKGQFGSSFVAAQDIGGELIIDPPEARATMLGRTLARSYLGPLFLTFTKIHPRIQARDETYYDYIDFFFTAYSQIGAFDTSAWQILGPQPETRTAFSRSRASFTRGRA